jgi:shikimate dehydrogenase
MTRKPEVTAKRKRAGVMGWPVKHSLSPRVHGFWLKKYGIDGDYAALPVPPEKLREELESLAARGYSGVNLTVPHKETALTCVDELEPLAQRIGAVNTITARADGSLLGRNTDVYGFAQNLLAAGFRSEKKPATLLGAGGAARAGLAALLEMGFDDVRILNRTRKRAEALAEEFAPGKIKAFDWGDARALEGACLLANATSLGLEGQPALQIALDALPVEAWVTDMVYAPLQTELLKQASRRGNRTVDGLGMLLHQARPAFAAFFGVDPEVTDELREFVLGGASC